MEAEKAQSNELILWLKSLDLPLWAKIALVAIMACILVGAGSILIHGLYAGNKEEISVATTLLAISLPVLLIVTALVFGSNGEETLKKRTARVLQVLIPACIKENFELTERKEKSSESSTKSVAAVHTAMRGCIADYLLTFSSYREGVQVELKFSIELNVKKANVIFWLPLPEIPINDVSLEAGNLVELIGQHRLHCALGAVAEGYKLNASPVFRSVNDKPMLGLVFIRFLPKDFLLQSLETLYFAQDIAFFVRGIADTGESINDK
jgi:hypothetical protein